MARTPARCPATRGRWRRLAQRPLPSMMIPMCRGSPPCGGGGTVLGSGGRRSMSDLQYLLLLPVRHLVDPGDVAVGDLLDLLQPAVDLVGAHLPLLLDLSGGLDLLAANVA